MLAGRDGAGVPSQACGGVESRLSSARDRSKVWRLAKYGSTLVGWRQALGRWLGGPFGRALLGLAEGGIYLAFFLLIEWGLLWLAERTMVGHNETVLLIFDKIEVMSALGVAALFLIHAVRTAWHYSRGHRAREE